MAPRIAALAAGLAMLPWTAMAAPPSSDASARAAADAQQDGKGGCVYITQLQGNRPLNDHSVIFRANVSDFYRLDFAQRCYALSYPDPRLILTPVGGIGLICRAIDLDVKVSEQGPGAFPEPCIPSSLHKMTPAEVAAVPKKDLP